MSLPLLDLPSDSLANHIVASRWGGVAFREHKGAVIEDLFSLNEGACLAVVSLRLADGPKSYLLGLEATASAEAGIVLETETGTNYFREVLGEGHFVGYLLRALRSGALSGRNGRLEIDADKALWQAVCEPADVKPLKGEQSNTSMLVGDEWLVKFYRKFNRGKQPEIEMGVYLTERQFEHIPPVLGAIRYVSEDKECSLALIQQFLSGAEDGWSLLTGMLRDALARPDTLRTCGLDLVERLAEATAQMHAEFARAGGELRAEPVTAADGQRWKETLLEQWVRTKKTLDASVRLPLDEAQLKRLAAWWETAEASGLTLRCHGDFHLGQTLWYSGKWYLIDFEGEPTKPLEQRRRKNSPLRDVAGLLRSLSYAAWSVLLGDPSGTQKNAESLLQWERCARERYLQAYFAHTGTTGLYPQSDEDCGRMLALFELEKALYELDYEARHRPDWMEVPLEGIRRIARRCISEAEE